MLYDRSLTAEHEQEMSRMKTEFETRLEELESEHKGQIKQLIKEFNSKVSEKDREFQETFGEAVGMSSQSPLRKNFLSGHKDLAKKQTFQFTQDTPRCCCRYC